MAFVKLDCGILNSTVWYDKDARTVFLTALLMAEPWELTEPAPQLQIRELKESGWSVPPGWYGFVPAASVGILARAQVDTEPGLDALERLGSPEPESRSKDFEGRRMIRVNGGFVILNYDKYRQRDYTAADRSKRYRERKAALRRDNVTSHVTSRKKKQNQKQKQILEVEQEVQREQRITDSPPSAALVSVKAKSWTAEACEDWSEASGGVAPGGRIGKALKPLVERVSREKGLSFDAAWESIRPYWRRFCESPDRRFGPQAFAENPKRVVETAQGKGVGERASEALSAYLESIRGS